MNSNCNELSNDIKGRLKEFRETSEKINKTIKLANDPDFYDGLSNADKIKYNLLMSFSLNGLFWMYLRAKGEDPNTNQIKAENDRLKQAMARSQEIKDRKTKMPRIDKDAAKRFVRSGLWTPKNNNDSQSADTVPDEEEENWDMPSASAPNCIQLD